MITRMEITYRSKDPCNIKPEIFSTGGYAISIDGKDLTFDFEEMYANTRFEDGYIHIDSLQKNLDEEVLDGIKPEIADYMLKSVKKEDFTEIYYECFADREENNPIELTIENITFYDFSESGDGQPIEVGGDSFCNLT